MQNTPTEQAKKHHDLLPLEVWSVYSDEAKQAEYNLARWELAKNSPEARKAQAADATRGWVGAFLTSLLVWTLFLFMALAFFGAW